MLKHLKEQVLMENDNGFVLYHPNKTKLFFLGVAVLVAEMIFVLAVIVPLLFYFQLFVEYETFVSDIYIESLIIFMSLGMCIIIFGTLYAKCPTCEKNIYFPLCKDNLKKYKHVSIIENAFKSVFKRKIICSCCNTVYSLSDN